MRSRLTFTPREKAIMGGRCPGPVESTPSPGEVDAGHRARCFRCGKLVRVTVRGRYAHHKPAAEKRCTGKVHAAYMAGDRICGAPSGATLPIGRADVTCGRCRRMSGLSLLSTPSEKS